MLFENINNFINDLNIDKPNEKIKCRFVRGKYF